MGLEDLAVYYADGNAAMFDHVRDMGQMFPQGQATNIIAICNSGVLSIDINGKCVHIEEGDVLLCPSNVRIDSCTVSEDFECKCLCLSDHIIQGLLRDKTDVWNHAVYVEQKYYVKMSDICKEEFGYYYLLLRSKTNNRQNLVPNEVIQTLIRALLLELCVHLGKLNGASHERKISQGRLLFNRFLSMISNSPVKRMPISSYASQLAITPKYLTMLCLKYSDKTASDWVVQYTLEDIRFYLRNTSLSIKEVSAKLGFANMSHFGSYVRKHMGMSPSEYREQNGRGVVHGRNS